MTNAHQSRKRRKERAQTIHAREERVERERRERRKGRRRRTKNRHRVGGWVYTLVQGGKEKEGLTHRESKDDVSTIQTTTNRDRKG